MATPKLTLNRDTLLKLADDTASFVHGGDDTPSAAQPLKSVYPNCGTDSTKATDHVVGGTCDCPQSAPLPNHPHPVIMQA
ncbi:MAG TPA: hypothetical protein VF804_10330 [Holophagaceae bacterium]